MLKSTVETITKHFNLEFVNSLEVGFEINGPRQVLDLRTLAGLGTDELTTRFVADVEDVADWY